MNRRQVVKGLAGAVAIAAAGTLRLTAKPKDDWFWRADKLNTFDPDDILEVRLRKFNNLTGMDLTLGQPWGEKYDGVILEGRWGSETEMKGTWRSLVYPNGRKTGPMDDETLMQWMAEVALGYRLAKTER